MQGERQREPSVVPPVDGSTGDTGNGWSCGQSSPSTGDFVVRKLNLEMAWPINFKLPLTLLTPPRLALRSMGSSHRRIHVMVWSISEGKNAWEGLSTCSGGKSRKRAKRRGQAQMRREDSPQGRGRFSAPKSSSASLA